MNDSTADPVTPSSGRRVAFYVIAFLLPFAVLALLEGLLRLTGFARPEPLFVPAATSGWLEPNPDVIQRFFASPGAAPDTQMDTTLFRAGRPEDGIRLVVQGGSTAAGFPYGKWASLAGALQQRLTREHPGQPVEVISTAMSAVNSYTLWDFGDEILELEPDAILIYAGHNEYLGILGVGSTWGTRLSPAATRRLLRARDVRVLALANRAWAAIVGGNDDAREGTLMARVASERRIPLGSPLYEAGLTQFRSNMGALLADYRDAGIPVYIGILAANERDQPPLLGPEDPNPATRQVREETTRLLEGGDPSGAEAAARAWVAADPGDPDGHYALGQALLASGRDTEARAAFVAAKDRDLLRFRAPEAINEIIRNLAETYGAQVVEVRGALAAASPPGGIGYEVMVEHLHPNAEGYFILADAYHSALREAELLPPPSVRIDRSQARAEFPLSRIEARAGEYRVARLLSDWPFQDPPEPVKLPEPDSDETAIAQEWFLNRKSWVEAMNDGLRLYQRTGDYDEAGRIAANMALGLPFEPTAQYAAGQMFLRGDQPARALPFLDAAARLSPATTRYRMSLAQGYYMADYKSQALAVLEAVLAADPGHTRAAELAARVREEIAAEAAARPQPD
jgi:tetratricopeptide (TPR) repeat protein